MGHVRCIWCWWGRRDCFPLLNVLNYGTNVLDRLMNQTLKKAISDVSSLPESDQAEIALEMIDLAARKRIDAMQSEERGGETPHAEFVAEFRRRHAS
jgi:hypothetical protein